MAKKLALHSAIAGLALGAVLTLTSSRALAALTVVNGDFETGGFSGWVTASGPAPSFGVDPFGPKIGSFSAFFGGIQPFDSITQTLAGTADGNAYKISFFLGNPVGSSAGGRFEVRFDDVTVFARSRRAPECALSGPMRARR